MKNKLPSKSSLIKKADKIFSLYIRQRYADEHGTAECFTCGKKDHWKKLQCGHFMSRRHYSTRWNEDNCQVQCSGCNVFRYGEQYKFSRNLNVKYKRNISEELLHLSRKTIKFSTPDLIELTEYYKNKLAQLK